MNCGAPCRIKRTDTELPGSRPSAAVAISLSRLIAERPNRVRMSPALTPPTKAGDPGSTELTTTPPRTAGPGSSDSSNSFTVMPKMLTVPGSLGAVTTLAISSASKAPISTSSSVSSPSLMIVISTTSPGTSNPTICGRSAETSTWAPSTATMISPDSIPARSAGELPPTCATKAPRGRSKSNDSASVRSTFWILTPNQPRTTSPFSRNCSTMLRTTRAGMAKDRPIEPPERVKICEFTPTTSPARLKSGPPELPGLIATSV